MFCVNTFFLTMPSASVCKHWHVLASTVTYSKNKNLKNKFVFCMNTKMVVLTMQVLLLNVEKVDKETMCFPVCYPTQCLSKE